MRQHAAFCEASVILSICAFEDLTTRQRGRHQIRLTADMLTFLQTYPELEVSPTVQAAALLGAGLLHRGTCHRCCLILLRDSWHP
jgi:hypothetical protein